MTLRSASSFVESLPKPVAKIARGQNRDVVQLRWEATHLVNAREPCAPWTASSEELASVEAAVRWAANLSPVPVIPLRILVSHPPAVWFQCLMLTNSVVGTCFRELRASHVPT